MEDTPIVVKSHDIHLDKEYSQWMYEIKERYRQIIEILLEILRQCLKPSVSFFSPNKRWINPGDKILQAPGLELLFVTRPHSLGLNQEKKGDPGEMRDN